MEAYGATFLARALEAAHGGRHVLDFSVARSVRRNVLARIAAGGPGLGRYQTEERRLVTLGRSAKSMN